jgi:2-hydroxy-3-oxopropionate reductase
MSSPIGFIGLGLMGKPMALNLRKKGFDVITHSRSRGPVVALVAAGARAADSPAGVALHARVIITMLPDGPDVETVLAGEHGVFSAIQPGTIIVDSSTIAPATARRLASETAARDAAYLDAPVSGGEIGAINAALSIMVGGEADDFAAAKPLFDVVGKTVVHVGPSGSGQTVKAANQLIVAANIQAVAEAVIFLEAYGVDTKAALEVLGGGLAGSAVLNQKKENMLSRSFQPGFRIDLHHKDMGIVTAAAREAGVVVPLGALVAQLVASARANGDGGLDHSALLRGVERLSGKAVG